MSPGSTTEDSVGRNWGASYAWQLRQNWVKPISLEVQEHADSTVSVLEQPNCCARCKICKEDIAQVLRTNSAQTTTQQSLHARARGTLELHQAFSLPPEPQPLLRRSPLQP